MFNVSKRWIFLNRSVMFDVRAGKNKILVYKILITHSNIAVLKCV